MARRAAAAAAPEGGALGRPQSPQLAISESRSRRRLVHRSVRFVVRGHVRALIKVAAVAFVGGIAEALFLVTVTRIAFAITAGHDRIGVVAGWYLSVDRVLLLALGLVLGRVALAAYATRLSVNLSTDVVAKLQHRLARAFLETSWSTQQEERSGSLQQLMTGFIGAASGVMGAVASGLVAAANLTAMLGTAVAVSPVGALVMVTSVALFSLVLRPLRTVVGRRAHASTAAQLDFAVSVNEVADLGLELHVFHVQQAARERVGTFVERVRRTSRRVGFASGMTSPIYSGLAYMTLLGALAAVAVSKTSTLTSLGAAMLVMLRSLAYGQALQGTYMSLSGSAPAIEHLQDRLHLFDSERRVDGGRPLGQIGAITAENVSFSYPAGPLVLRDVSFTIRPHEIVGIVGPSGSGKSTLVQLLLGLRDPDSGRILADGRDIAGFDRSEWARSVTFVPQTAHLISGTIRDNVRFLRDEVSQEDVERALRLAHLDDEILSFAGGYDHQVGEHGSHLSGGQQQRLSIARALAAHPALLILDEPTSALDVRSEHLIRTTLLDLKQELTVIVIAHRMSTLTICDRIMVIQDGTMKGFDSPSALEGSSPFYREVLALSGLR